MKKRFAFFLLIILVIVGVAGSALAAGLYNFTAVNTYTSGQFTDVSPTDWYAEEVELAYKYDLVEGKTTSTYVPDNYLRLSEAITLAARMHNIYYTGSNQLTNGSPLWYAPYVDYALENDIITSEYPDYDAHATREQFAVIFAAALPSTALTEINEIELGAIPDVPYGASYGPSVYELYRAGVLIGNDGVGTFRPYDNIKRSEVAAIVARMTNTTYRKSLTLTSSGIYYTDYYPVPDYGSYLDVSLYQSDMHYDTETGTYNMAYAYKLSGITADYNEYFYGYGDLLTHNGFAYQLEYLDEYGYPTLYYANDLYGWSVYLGPTEINGIDCILVIIGSD